MSNYSLIVPLLNQDHTYAYGVELGLQVLAPMLRGDSGISGYFRVENEEQIRLCAHRLGYKVVELEPWIHKGKDTGWIWIILSKVQG